MKKANLFFFFNFFLLFKGVGQSLPDVNVKDLETIYPKLRIWNSPSHGEEARFNSPSLQWPSIKKATYSVRLSSSFDFKNDLIEKAGIPYAIFNPHQTLRKGKWYWQYKSNTGNWNPVDSFVIASTTKLFPTPAASTLISHIPNTHPRILVKAKEIDQLLVKSMSTKERTQIIKEANEYIKKAIPLETSAMATLKGKDDFENDKLSSLACKWAGLGIQDALNTISQAYILTGDRAYFLNAKKWMLEISIWNPKGPSHANDFGDAAIMSSLAIALDTFWDMLTADERAIILKQISARGRYFYQQWVGQVESRSSSMHVWQHILHQLLQTAMVIKDELPEANAWIEYIYELWIAQSPKMAEEDGAWINGTSYFEMNVLTLIDVPSIFKELSGIDFMQSAWYKNNPRWLMYAFPPNSIADGFCNNGDRYEKPIINYAGYAHAMADLFNDPNAAWYANQVAKSLGKDISDDIQFRWYRITQGNKRAYPSIPNQLSLPQAAVFPEVGVAYMHTNLSNAQHDLMLSVRSSPYGPMAHAQAEQNTFNIAFGGKRLFNNTGYRPAMGDPHFLGWHKHTQGHNGILIDGQGQPYNASAYGWLPRFLHGEKISYALGDASNAYRAYDEGQHIDLGMKVSRRHYLMLRPSIVVVYDELEAEKPVTWSWLLHNDLGFNIDSISGTLTAGSEVAKASVRLFGSTSIHYNLTDQFSVPVNNWTNKVNEDGDTLDFKNQWHFSGDTKVKTQKMRYLAIFQIKENGDFQPVIQKGTNDSVTIGDWVIQAEMDVTKKATIKVFDLNRAVSFVSEGVLLNNGKAYPGKESSSSKLIEMVKGKMIYKESKDEIPMNIKRAMIYKQHLSSSN